MLRKFDEGRRDDFFTLWQQYVPASLLGLDFATQKFEFYLQVYFSIYPVLPSSSVLVVTPAQGSRLSSQASSSRHELVLRMKAFKAYLEGRGAGLAHTAEFLPYYALPYVPQPEHHPSFEGLFHSRWVDEQRMHLKAFLEDLAARASHVPLLYVMYAEHLQATDGVPRLSPRARALRASSRAHPYSSSQSREASRGSVGNGGLGLSQSHHPCYPPGVRLSGAGPGRASHSSGGGGILGNYESSGGGSAAASPSRRARAGLPPRSRPVSGMDGRHAAAASSPPPLTAAAAAAAPPPRRRGSRPATGAAGDDDDDDGDLEGLIQDDDDAEGLAGEEDEEEQARAAEVLRRQREADDAAEEEEVEAAMQEALRTPTNTDLPQGRAFPPAAPVDAGGVRASVALSLERLGLREDAVFRDSVQLLDSTLGGTLDMSMASELMAAGKAAAAGAAAAAEAATARGSVAVAAARRPGSCTGLAPLDYRKLKQDLQGPDTLLAARLLQALRWRLTRSRPGADRWGLIASWIEVDLLDCHTPVIPPPLPGCDPASAVSSSAADAGGPWSLLRALAASPDPVAEEVSRLANAIASDRLGRNYLMLPGAGAVPALMGVLRTAKMPNGGGHPGQVATGASENGPQGRVVSKGAGSADQEETVEDEAGAPPAESQVGSRRRSGTARRSASSSGSVTRSRSATGSGKSDGGASDGRGGGSAVATRDGAAVQQALVTLQKLSLKRVAQSQMIRMGAVAWVVEFLQDATTVSATAIEYGTALLMNLCLRSAGRAAAAAVAAPLLQLCETLLTCNNDQVRTYIHGTLYSVFARASIREVAGRRGTAQLLEEVAQSGQAPFASQSQYILRQLYMPESDGSEERDQSADEAAPDGDADMEAVEGVEDAYADVDITPESLQQAPGEPCGEVLLCASGYLASTRQAREHLSAVRSSVAAAAAVMAAAGKSTLRGSVLLGSLPRPPRSERSGGAAGGGGRAAVEGEADEEVEEKEGGRESGAGAKKATGATEAPLDSEPSSSAPSSAGHDDASQRGDQDEDDEDGIYEDDAEEGSEDEGVSIGGGEAAIASSSPRASAQGQGLGPGNGAEEGDPPGPEDTSGCPSPSATAKDPGRGASRGGSRRESLAMRGSAAAGGGAVAGGSLRPSMSSSSAYVSLATSTASTSIMAAARALEAARLSGSTLGSGTGAAGTIVAGGGIIVGDDIAGASPNSSMAASRRRSFTRPLLPSSSASLAATAAALAAHGPVEADDNSGGGCGAAASSVFGSLGAAPPRPPSQGLGPGQCRPPTPPPPLLGPTASQEGALGAGGTLRPGSRPQSPFRPGRGSLVSSTRRRTSESGGQILATSAAAAAVAAAAADAAGGDGGERASQDASRLLRRSASANGGAVGAGSNGASTVFIASGTAEGDVGALERSQGGTVTVAPDLHRHEPAGPLTSRASLGKPPLRASGAGVAGASPPPPLVMASRPGTGAPATGGEPRHPRASSPASRRAAAADAGVAAVDDASPGSSLSSSPAPALTGPAPHQINYSRNTPLHQHSLAAPGSQASAVAAAGGRGHGHLRPGYNQGQPFPITAASSQAFASKPADSPVPIMSLRSSQAGASSTAGTPRDAESPLGVGMPDGGASAAAASVGGSRSVISPLDGNEPARSRAIPRPPGPPIPGAVADGRSPAGSGSRVSGPGTAAGAGARVDSKRSPTPPNGRAQPRSRLGSTGPKGAPAASAGPPPSPPPAPPPAEENDLLPLAPPAEYTAPVKDDNDDSIFATRRQLPRTPGL